MNAPAAPTTLPSLRDKVTTVRDLFLANREQIQMALPRHLNAERMIRVAMTSFSTTPKLMDCTPRSLLGAVIQCAQLGLEPGLLGHAYLIPFWNSKARAMEVQLIVGYRGLLQLARRSGEISTIVAHEVRQGDRFTYHYGLTPALQHGPSEAAERQQAAITHFYAVARLKDGGSQFEVMTRAEIDAHRDRYSRAAKDGPWVTNYAEMGLKTVLRRLAKLLPCSIELQQAVVLDEHAEQQIPQDLGALVEPEDAADNGRAAVVPGKALDRLAETLETPEGETATAEAPEPTQADQDAAERAVLVDAIRALIKELQLRPEFVKGYTVRYCGVPDYTLPTIALVALSDLKAGLEKIKAGAKGR
jgi:recombination protein RecT